jgi:hypothetical protein
MAIDPSTNYVSKGRVLAVPESSPWLSLDPWVGWFPIGAYHQPVARAEIEEIRGVITSKGTLDVLLETGWIRPRGRRKTPGRPPVTMRGSTP